MIFTMDVFLNLCSNGAVYVGSSTPIDTSAHEPDSTLLTTMRALKVGSRIFEKLLRR